MENYSSLEKAEHRQLKIQKWEKSPKKLQDKHQFDAQNLSPVNVNKHKQSHKTIHENLTDQKNQEEEMKNEDKYWYTLSKET